MTLVAKDIWKGEKQMNQQRSMYAEIAYMMRTQETFWATIFWLGKITAAIFLVCGIVLVFNVIDGKPTTNVAFYALWFFSITAILTIWFDHEWDLRYRSYTEILERQREKGHEVSKKLVSESYTKLVKKFYESEKRNPVTLANEFMDLVQIFLSLGGNYGWVENLVQQCPDFSMDYAESYLTGALTEVSLYWQNTAGMEYRIHRFLTD